MKLNKKIIILASAATLSLGIFSLPSYAKTVTDGENYTVTDGKYLDAKSYKGFKLFRNWCARCHNRYGQGLVGPDLTQILKQRTKEEVFKVIETGKTGQIGSMPTWKKNKQVMKNRDKIYAYLKARSDGAIGEVHPKKAK